MYGLHGEAAAILVCLGGPDLLDATAHDEGLHGDLAELGDRRQLHAESAFLAGHLYEFLDLRVERPIGQPVGQSHLRRINKVQQDTIGGGDRTLIHGD